MKPNNNADYTLVMGQLAQVCQAYADTEIIYYNGEINRKDATNFINKVPSSPNSKAILLLETPGGDADAAYKIVRHLQCNFQHITLFVANYCKSAGTLIAFGVDQIKMTDQGELGPLDVQLNKADEIGALTSGLNTSDALDMLISKAQTTFEAMMIGFRVRSRLQISTKMAAEIATNLTTGLLSPVISKIDPIYMAETQRSLSIANEYATRLNRGIIKDGAVGKLIYGYPSHGFVIDRKEASELFENVVSPDKNDEFLINFLPFSVYRLKDVRYIETGDGEATIFNISKGVREYELNSQKAAHELQPQPAKNATDGTGENDKGNGSDQNNDAKSESVKVAHLVEVKPAVSRSKRK